MSFDQGNGYPVRDLAKYDVKYKCPACLKLLRDPIQLSCGCRWCFSCISPNKATITCLTCSQSTKITEIMRDIGFLKDMQILRVECTTCDWFGYLSDYQNHLESCRNNRQCTHCGEVFQAHDLLVEHKEKRCSQILVHCGLEGYGCTEKIRRSDLGQHFLTVDHQKNALCFISQLSSADRHQRSSVSTNDACQTEEALELPATVRNITSSSMVTQDRLDPGLGDIQEGISILSASVSMFADESRNLADKALEHSQTVERTSECLSRVKLSIEELTAHSSASELYLQIFRQEIQSLQWKYTDKQSGSYDGTLLWKITEVAEKMGVAKSERQTSIYSPPFYSSPTGYHMKARIYLYGDGNARRTHMSVFFVLMRGKHDALLHFPFNYKVTFCLFDQTSAQCHVIDSFRPDTKSNSFQRPRSDMNIASGIPKFVSLAMLENPDTHYIKNDAMFIKVMVDFQSLPKEITPYAVRLNPGLPMLVQQGLIAREIEQIKTKD